MPALTDPIYTDEDAARVHIEAQRWPNGVVCPFCGGMENVRTLGGKSMGPGWYHCGDCREKFTVRVGTVLERSHVPLHKWVLAFRLLCGSKKGMSAHQLHRTLGVTYKTAWFMAHRIREAMAEPGSLPPMGGEGKTIEADETYIGRKPGAEKKRAFHHKMAVLSLVERGGKVRSFHVDKMTTETVAEVVKANADRRSHLRTDEARHYVHLGREFASHESVQHSGKEYVRGTAHTNTIEGFFSVFKRGMRGVYQHCAEKHLHRYLAEFDFRYNQRSALGVDDIKRACIALAAIEGKRLTYRRAA